MANERIKLSIGGKEYDFDEEKICSLIEGFCLFDLSYGNYDGIEPESFDVYQDSETVQQEIKKSKNPKDKRKVLAKDAIKLAFQIRARFSDKHVRAYFDEDIKRKVRSALGVLKNKENTQDRVKQMENLLGLFCDEDRKFKYRYLLGTNITKMLHRYAPERIPILDNLCMKHHYKITPGTLDDSLKLIKNIWDDVRKADKTLTKISEKLKSKDISLSKLRIFDIILWTLYRSKTIQRVPENEILK